MVIGPLARQGAWKVAVPCGFRRWADPDSEDILTIPKVSGSPWLSITADGITADGTLSGTPSAGDMDGQRQRRLELAHPDNHRGSVSTTSSSSGTAPDLWMKLKRSRNAITAFRSADGTNWTAIGSATVPMASDCDIGLCNASGSPHYAEHFRNG